MIKEYGNCIYVACCTTNIFHNYGVTDKGCRLWLQVNSMSFEYHWLSLGTWAIPNLFLVSVPPPLYLNFYRKLAMIAEPSVEDA